ncbi:phospholipid/cholesterol/gamma-HCH transport system permease protein [Rhizobiales bacterium GAS113]|nr:phospholipid/cholesterol/gamma-HCH transport system permease protein [Rhizobiales bacterium GAS113]
MSVETAQLGRANEARLTIKAEGGRQHAKLSGHWTADQAPAIERFVSEVLDSAKARMPVVLDLASIERLDTIGAWIIDRTLHDLRSRGAKGELVGVQPKHEALLREVEAHGLHAARRESEDDAPELLVDIGKGVSDTGNELIVGLSFFGEVVIAAARLLRWRRHFRAPAFVHQMELIILRGVPIIVLISFVVGGIIAQQGIFQLRRFDAADFVVDLIGILALRELGVLLASIMVAGRSGSSFTAELGAMKMREEIDALRVMGFDPIDVLIIPRLLALTIGLPMLAFLADMSALCGGGLVAWLYQGISPQAFLAKLQVAISMHTFLAGLIKAPFMALIIGLIASIEGLAVKGSTEDLGRHVTASVVKAIFMVIVVDGLFAMFFATIDY